MIAVDQQQIEIASDLAAFTHDPLKAVMYGFPWGEGDLEASTGPRKWQAEVLEDIGKHLRNPATRHQPCRIAVSSGHDIGKSSLIAMIIWWGLSTFEDTRVNITANTDNQLKTKTSPELAKWFRLCINSDWFDKTVTSIKVREDKHLETWRGDLVPWSETNPAASAGLHNKGKRVILVFDESSEIPQIIFDVGEGVMLDEDTETIWLIFGNPTWSHGPFYEAVFGTDRTRWRHRVIDSRDVEGTNKTVLQEWEEHYGEDSDFFRVRARGLPPHSDEGQFIDRITIAEAQKRIPFCLPTDALVAGCDMAWGGSDDNVVRFRRGKDCRSIPPIRIRGALTRDPMVMINRLAEVLARDFDGVKVAMLFVDSAGIAGPVVAGLRALGHENVREINFGADSPDMHYAYFRDYMWGMMKQALIAGAAIDPRDQELANDLAGPTLIKDLKQRVKLESKEDMKKRGISSPDDGDALALTFAAPVAVRTPEPPRIPIPQSVWS